MNIASSAAEKREKHELLSDALHVYRLLSEVRENLTKVFLEAGDPRKLHPKYVLQRDKRAWGGAENIDKILKKYSSKKELVQMYRAILTNNQIATWIKVEDVNQDDIAKAAESLATHQIEKTKPNIEVIGGLLIKIWVAPHWVDRFLSWSLAREISQKMEK